MTAAGRAADRQDGRGRSAERPSDIPKRGWRDVALRVKDELSTDNISHIAAGVAFYWLLAMFPAAAALISIYGLVADPVQLEQQILQLSGVMPDYVRELLRQQLDGVVAGNNGALGLAAAAGILFSLWSAAKGVKALIVALNIAYDEEEKRGFVKLNLVALGLTLGMILFVALALGLLIALPAVIDLLPFGELGRMLALWGRWPLLFAGMVVAMAVLYDVAPSRDRPRWRWVSWGAVSATALWLIASIVFSIYVSNFGSYNETYGSVGAIIFLLMWFWISAFLVLLGAELNAELEHQTERDTTKGPPEPRGARGAYVADTVGEAKS